MGKAGESGKAVASSQWSVTSGKGGGVKDWKDGRVEGGETAVVGKEAGCGWQIALTLYGFKI